VSDAAWATACAACGLVPAGWVIASAANAQHTPAEAQAITAARSTLHSCRQRLDRYRAALEAGTDAQLVQTWIASVQEEQSAAQAKLRLLDAKRPLIEAEIANLVASLGDITNVIKGAEPTDKAQLYGDLGVRLTYQPDQRLVSAEVDLDRSCTRWAVSFVARRSRG
jgi:redox-sensitive bicupin YhaK (pirin superfamily)